MHFRSFSLSQRKRTIASSIWAARFWEKNLNLNYDISLILIKFLNCSFKRQLLFSLIFSAPVFSSTWIIKELICMTNWTEFYTVEASSLAISVTIDGRFITRVWMCFVGKNRNPLNRRILIYFSTSARNNEHFCGSTGFYLGDSFDSPKFQS